jgi:hypothetical protein
VRALLRVPLYCVGLFVAVRVEFGPWCARVRLLCCSLCFVVRFVCAYLIQCTRARASAITKVYPSFRSLYSVYADPSLTAEYKSLLLKVRARVCVCVCVFVCGGGGAQARWQVGWLRRRV